MANFKRFGNEIFNINMIAGIHVGFDDDEDREIHGERYSKEHNKELPSDYAACKVYFTGDGMSQMSCGLRGADAEKFLAYIEARIAAREVDGLL